MRDVPCVAHERDGVHCVRDVTRDHDMINKVYQVMMATSGDMESCDSCLVSSCARVVGNASECWNDVLVRKMCGSAIVRHACPLSLPQPPVSSRSIGENSRCEWWVHRAFPHWVATHLSAASPRPRPWKRQFSLLRLPSCLQPVSPFGVLAFDYGSEPLRHACLRLCSEPLRHAAFDCDLGIRGMEREGVGWENQSSPTLPSQRRLPNTP